MHLVLLQAAVVVNLEASLVCFSTGDKSDFVQVNSGLGQFALDSPYFRKELR